MNFNEEALKLHAEHKGKIEIRSKVPVNTRDDLSTAYTPVSYTHLIITRIRKSRRKMVSTEEFPLVALIMETPIRI